MVATIFSRGLAYWLKKLAAMTSLLTFLNVCEIVNEFVPTYGNNAIFSARLKKLLVFGFFCTPQAIICLFYTFGTQMHNHRGNTCS